jgi:hypothetical protein
MLTDEAHDILTDTFNPIAQELFLNEVKFAAVLIENEQNVDCGGNG